MEKLRRQLHKEGIITQVMKTPPDGMKLSEALLELVSPFSAYADSLHAFENLIGMGVAAWNLYLLDGPVRESFEDQVVKPFLTSDADGTGKEMFALLVRRRKAYFPNDRRFIVNYTVTRRSDGFNVMVAGAMNAPSGSPGQS